MQIYGVSFDMVGKQPIVLLKTADGNRFLPIWIGHPEAAAILMKLQGASTPRPMTHDLMADLLDNIDAKCERISVTELRDNTFYATITLTVDGNRFLPIWIGHPEAAAILMKLQGASTPRPMTHDLLSDLLEQLDAKCERVSVTELRDNTFYASITVSINGSEVEIDSRPSDALALAVRVSAPIFAAEEVIEESAIEFEHEVEDTEEVVDKFKEFLDEVTPEDFASGDS